MADSKQTVQCITCSQTQPPFIHITRMSTCGYVVDEEMWQCAKCWGKPKCQFCGNVITKNEATTSELYDDPFCDDDELLMYMRDTGDRSDTDKERSSEEDEDEDEDENEDDEGDKRK